MEASNLNEQKECYKPLKIYRKYFKRFGYYSIFPEIRLSGKWVEKLGFTCGDTIKIRAQKNRIIITNAEKIKVIL